ncbi:MAG: hypothetical protein MJ208_04165 [Bacilli bacterium]|nr:hypothetical protein [Bacilli bacterium]
MNKITKNRIIIAIICLSILGSIITFHATNLLLASIVNKGCPIKEFLVTFFPSLTFLMVSLDFVLFIFFFLRLYLHPTHEQRILRVYGVILACFSGVGIAMNTLSGLITYGSFLVPHPIVGFHIIMYIYHILMLAFAFVMIFYLPKKVVNDDIIVHKTTPIYVLETTILALIIFIALNRLGAFILSPTFIQWRTLALTYPAYVALILPTIILVVDLVYVFQGFNKFPEIGITISSFVLFLSLFCCGQICYRGINDQLFIQLISPINPIGRLLTFPYDALLQMLVACGLSTFTLVNSIIFKRATDFNKLPYELRMAKLEGRKANFLHPELKSNNETSKVKTKSVAAKPIEKLAIKVKPAKKIKVKPIKKVEPVKAAKPIKKAVKPIKPVKKTKPVKIVKPAKKAVKTTKKVTKPTKVSKTAKKTKPVKKPTKKGKKK